MTVIVSLLTFIAMLCLGIAIAIGSGVGKWNRQWDLYATVQVYPGGDAPAVEKIIADARTESFRALDAAEISRLIKPWLDNATVLGDYLPKMWEVKFKNPGALSDAKKEIAALDKVQFIRHSDGMKNSVNAAIRIAALAGLIMALMIGALALCVSFVVRNTTMIHARELEILNQIGASDRFVVRQLQLAIIKITALATAIGLVAGIAGMLAISAIASGARFGVMSGFGLSAAGVASLIALGIFIIVFSVWAAGRTTKKILVGA